MHHSRPLGLSLATLLLTACVTINIYFPAAAAEKAADRIIRDVWGEPPQPPEVAPEQPPAAEPSPRGDAGRDGAARLFFWVRPAHAQANIDISTPAINQLTASMKQRYGALEPYFSSGAVGLTRAGMVEVRDLQAVPVTERNKARQLVADENRDRAALYKEIAVANQHPEWEPDIRATFARRWVANARPGWWYQDEAGAWRRK